MNPADKVRELRARRTLARRGYRLSRARRRDHAAMDYGTYRLYEIPTGELAAEYLSLDQIEERVAAGQRVELQHQRRS
jgi:hypothetical protein